MRRTEFIKLMTISALAGCSQQSDNYGRAVKLEMVISKLSAGEKINLLNSAGFSGFELNSSGYCLTEVKNAARRNSMKAVSVFWTDCWSKPLNHPDAVIRKEASASLKKALEEADFLNAEFVNVIPGVRIKGQNCKEGLKQAIDTLGDLIPTLKKTGVRLVLQNVKAGFIETSRQMADFLKAFDSSETGVCLDIQNITEGDSISAWKQRLGKKIFTVHSSQISESSVQTAWQILDGCGGSIKWLKAFT